VLLFHRASESQKLLECVVIALSWWRCAPRNRSPAAIAPSATSR
jgi:hypothetical protein